jgi:hypothetical protein
MQDLGAEVIKIEDPATKGDVSRHVPSPRKKGEDNVYFEVAFYSVGVCNWKLRSRVSALHSARFPGCRVLRLRHLQTTGTVIQSQQEVYKLGPGESRGKESVSGTGQESGRCLLEFARGCAGQVGDRLQLLEGRESGHRLVRLSHFGPEIGFA